MVEGRIIYQGEASATEQYFDKNFNLKVPAYVNPADFFISIMHHEDPENVRRYPDYFRVYNEQIADSVNDKIENRANLAI